MTHLQLAIAHQMECRYAPAVLRTFGENLRRLREGRKLSQERLAELLGHKRPSTVQSWEKNRRRAKPDSVRALAKALKCEPWELLEGVETEFDRLKQPDAKGAEATSTTRAEFPRGTAADRKRERLAAAKQDRRLKARR
jgi:transcriptional regulator with XRE-family HTH domain